MFAQVCTRDFGYFLPETCLIPMADNHNHSDRNACTYEFVTKDLHLRAETKSDYFKQERFMCDFSELYAADSLCDEERQNVKGRFNQSNFMKNEEHRKSDSIRKQMEERQVWEVECHRDRFLEENDSSDSDEKEEEVIDSLKKALQTKKYKILAERHMSLNSYK